MSQIFCKFGHSTSMCFTVCGSLQNPKVAGYSRDSIWECVKWEWPICSLLMRTLLRRKIYLCGTLSMLG